MKCIIILLIIKHLPLPKPSQMISAYYDQSGSLVMGPRTGTPMRLVSPAPVLVPPGAQRAPQAPQIYPPQPQQTQQSLYGAQNGNSVGGKCFGSLHWFGPDLSIVFSVLVCPPALGSIDIK